PPPPPCPPKNGPPAPPPPRFVRREEARAEAVGKINDAVRKVIADKMHNACREVGVLRLDWRYAGWVV
ncbi:MAG: hypothetical protein WCO26_16715, partial [Deltaproteobacteria bacterium]